MRDACNTALRLLAAAAILGIASGEGTCRAQDVDEDEEVEAAAPARAAFHVAESNFDAWVYGGTPGGPAAAWERFESSLTMHLDELDRICGLSEAQKKKLQLAGRGDLKRLKEQIEEQRRAFRLVQDDQQKFQKFYQGLQPLIQRIQAGVHGDGSLLAKILRKSVNEAQFARYEAAERAKQRARYRAKVELAIAILDDSIGMKAAQRRRLLELLDEKTRPPTKFGQYDYYLVLFRLAKLAEQARPLFDEVQWQKLNQHLNHGRGLEMFLRQQGYLNDEPEDGRPEGPAGREQGVER